MPRPPKRPATVARAATRLVLVDAARGAAIAQMVAYHFCYDLNYFGWIHLDLLGEPAWIAWRTAIVTQFLFVAGVALALRPAAPGYPLLRSAAFWKRWAQVALCAVLVSASSRLLFGPRFIWFGVLHFVAVALVVLAPLVRWRLACTLLGIVALAAGLGLTAPFFSADALSWIGFSPTKPHTEDFVPLFPWLGIVLLGAGAGGCWLASNASWSARLRALRAPALEPLAVAGRWPLTLYMLHQPLLFALFNAIALLRPAH